MFDMSTRWHLSLVKKIYSPSGGNVNYEKLYHVISLSKVQVTGRGALNAEESTSQK